MKIIFAHLKKNYPLLILLALFSFLFFFHLDYNTLVSWDEAWYGSIAREILKTGNWLSLRWNGNPYYDHPPMGFWLMAICYKLFGISELSTRLPSAILGLLTIILCYKLVELLFKKSAISFTSALILGTSVWYLIRVRSGNLESVFIFFYVLTIFVTVKAEKDFRWFTLLCLAFGGLMLSKTLVGLSALILILFYNFKQIFKVKKNIWYVLIGLVLFLLLVIPWYYYQIKSYPDFILRHFFIIGIRKKNLFSFFNLKSSLPLFYLHMGIRKWYYLWLLSCFFLVVSFKWLKKPVLFLLLWNFVILYPFLTSDKTEIWHLIPVYLPLSIIIAYGIYEFINFIFSIGKRIFGRIKYIKALLNYRNIEIIYLLFIVTIAIWQIKIFYPEIFPEGMRYIPDDVAISKRLTDYQGKLFLDDDFLPIAVFYSGKDIQTLVNLTDDKKTLVKLYQSDEKKFIVVTRNWAVNNLKEANISYRLLEKNNSFSIIEKQ